MDLLLYFYMHTFSLTQFRRAALQESFRIPIDGIPNSEFSTMYENPLYGRARAHSRFNSGDPSIYGGLDSTLVKLFLRTI